MKKVKKNDTPNDALLVAADVTVLYPCIPHEVIVKVFVNAFDKQKFWRKVN